MPRKKVLTESQRRKNAMASNERWRRANTRIVNVRFRLEEDRDVLEKLDSVDNKADYIRQLILDDIKGE